MRDIFGEVTPFVVMLTITLLTEYVKRRKPEMEATTVHKWALRFALGLIIPFELLFNWPETTTVLTIGRLLYTSVIYAIFGWFSAIGMYEVGSKGYRAYQVARQVRIEQALQRMKTPH